MNPRITSAFVLLLGLAFAACASTPRGLPTADALIRRGEESLNEGRLDEARALFLQSAASSPSPFLAWVGAARTAVARGDVAEAGRALAEAMARDPGSPESADLLGRTFLAAGRVRVPADPRQASIALNYFRRAAVVDAEIPNLRFHTGLAAWDAGDAELAVAALESAHAAEPNAPFPIRALLDLHRSLGGRADVARLLAGVERRAGTLPEAYADDAAFARGP